LQLQNGHELLKTRRLEVEADQTTERHKGDHHWDEAGAPQDCTPARRVRRDLG
jgi:hypothetical protein